jgi:hypothetical protein
MPLKAAVSASLQGPEMGVDLALPASNRLGIPDLDPAMAPAGVPLPVWCWGQTARTRPNPGTWHHYTSDYRFGALEKNPCALLATGCVAAVEVNYSVFDDTPLALAFATIYRKRYIARLWQLAGVAVFIDANLPERVLDAPESRYGIPDGYPAFATRGYERRMDALEAEYQWACSFGAPKPVFLVVGGGRKVAEWCQDTPGAFHSGYATTKRAYSGLGYVTASQRRGAEAAGRLFGPAGSTASGSNHHPCNGESCE